MKNALLVLLISIFISCEEKDYVKKEIFVKQNSLIQKNKKNDSVYKKDELILSGYWVCSKYKSNIDESISEDELESAKIFKNTKVLFMEGDSLFVGYQCGVKFSFSNITTNGLFIHKYELDDFRKRLLQNFNVDLKDSIGVIINYEGLSQSCDILDSKLFYINGKIILEKDNFLYLFEKNYSSFEKILQNGNIVAFPVTINYLENETSSNSHALYNKDLKSFGLCGDLEYFTLPSNNNLNIFIFKNYCGDDFTYTLVTINNAKIISQIEISGILFNEKDSTKNMKSFIIKDDLSLLIKDDLYINNELISTKKSSYIINKNGEIK